MSTWNKDQLDEKIEQIERDSDLKLDSVDSDAGLEEWRIEFLGSKGKIKEVMNDLQHVPRENKAEFGKKLNELKKSRQEKLAAKKALQLQVPTTGGEPKEDVTLPGEKLRIGCTHIITQTIQEICDIFGRMGFEVVYGPEVEDEWHSFEALNTPPAHPARDPLDNFYIGEKFCLRPQTSTVQIREMENRQPPIRVVAPGRCYRPDTVDTTHSFMFYQIEGLYVDEGVSMVDLRTCVDQFCKAYFGTDVETRFRPHFFPFTEPSAEVDLLFHTPDGSTKWIEMGGCGMVDPNVLEAVKIDPEKYTGWAFGLGIERMLMRKHNVPDIRMLFESDIRFLQQF